MVKIFLDIQGSECNLSQWLIRHGWTESLSTIPTITAQTQDIYEVDIRDLKVEMENQLSLNDLDKASPPVTLTPPAVVNHFSSESEHSNP